MASGSAESQKRFSMKEFPTLLRKAYQKNEDAYSYHKKNQKIIET